MAELTEPLLRMRGVAKSFGPVAALAGVDLEVRRGEVHALIGENGAGKSTLMKILSGAHRADSGEIELAGRPYAPATPAQARTAGVAMIYQELTLCPDLTVAENITLGAEESCCGLVRRQPARLREALARLGYGDLALDRPVGGLSLGVQQVVEIARALVLEARLIILDEPTSSLTGQDAQNLFAAIDRLRAQGLAIIYISHFLEEIQRLGNRFTVLRDGRSVGGGEVASTPIRDIVELMVGRTVDELYPKTAHALGETVLELRGLADANRLGGIDLTLRRGEILGLAGIIGAGRSETLRALFGLEPADAGTLRLFGRADELRAANLSPNQMLHLGLDLLSENRKEEGLAVDRPLWDNLTLSSAHRRVRWGWTSPRGERAAAGEWLAKLRVRHHNPDQPAGDLSGGNQQKIALARLLLHGADILLLDEPTRGIDIGSKQEIYRLIGELAAAGKALIVVSSYLPELFGLCDTLAVMHRGRLSRTRPIGEWTETAVMHFATSGRE